MKRMAGWAIAIAAITVIFSSPLHALTGSVTDPNAPAPLAGEPVVITAFSGAQTLDFIELYNQTDKAIDITGWTVRVVTADKTSAVQSEADIAAPAGLLLPDSYVALGRGALVAGADGTYNLTPAPNDVLRRLEVHKNTGLGSAVDIPSGTDLTKWYQRKSGSSGLMGVFADFSSKTGAGALRGKGMYQLPPSLHGVAIVELYAHPLDCAPNDLSKLCHDYLKILNTTDDAIDLTPYRLKTDSGTSEIGNTFYFTQSIAPHSLLTVTSRSDGAPLSLTNTGGYAWFEDVEGVQRYDETIAGYPDASADSRQGQSWAQDSSGLWQWSLSPQPEAPNIFPVVEAVSTASSVAEPAPCPAGKYRSLETNRCRTVEEAIAVLAACDIDEVRNPETNRCKKAAALATATLAPCAPGQERNPDTNRCRALASTTSDDPKPCPAGQERNPATNRCRAVTSAISSPAGLVTDPEQNKSKLNLPLVGAISAVVVGYALYEWRREMAKGLAWAVSKVKR